MTMPLLCFWFPLNEYARIRKERLDGIRPLYRIPFGRKFQKRQSSLSMQSTIWSKGDVCLKFKDKASASVRKAEGSAKVSLESLQNIPIIGSALYWTICTFFFGILGAPFNNYFPSIVPSRNGCWLLDDLCYGCCHHCSTVSLDFGLGWIWDCHEPIIYIPRHFRYWCNNCNLEFKILRG